MAQTVKDFVTNPISGVTPIDETARPIPDYMVTGTPAPVGQLAFAPTIQEVTNVPTPMHLLWRRPYTIVPR